MYTDIRWQQRFQNLEKSYIVFQRRIKEYRKHQQDEANQMALIQAFEIIIELSWKTLKDYLKFEGAIANSPKEVIRQSFQFKLIDNGENWMQALAKRNLITHIYDKAIFNQVINFINEKFTPIIEKLYTDLKQNIK